MLLKSLVFIAILGTCLAEHAYSSHSIVVHHEHKGQDHSHENSHEHKHEHTHDHHHEHKHEPEHKHEHATPVKPLVHVEKKAELEKVEVVTSKKEIHVVTKKLEEITKKPDGPKKLKSVVHHEISHVHKHEHHVPEKVSGPIVTQKAELVAHYIVKGTEHKHEHKEEQKHEHNEGHKYEHKEEHNVEHKHEHDYKHKEEPKQEHNHDHKNEHKQDNLNEHKHEQYAHAYSSQHIIRHDVPAPPPKEHYKHHAPAKYEHNEQDSHHHQESLDGHFAQHAADKKTGFHTDIKHTTAHVEETKKH